VSECGSVRRACRRLRLRHALAEEPFELEGGPAFSLLRPRSPDTLMHDALATNAPDLPYWSELWESGVALAHLVWRRRGALAGTRAVELGCGLGLVAVAGLLAGLRLVATDREPDALAFARCNTARVAGRAVPVRLLDWAAPLAGFGGFQVALGADVAYEPPQIEPLLAVCTALLVPGGALWLAQPGRRSAWACVRRFESAGWTETERLERPVHLPGSDPENVWLHLLRRPAVPFPALHPAAARSAVAGRLLTGTDVP
jgi:predicted nicotinamide N-methyase